MTGDYKKYNILEIHRVNENQSLWVEYPSKMRKKRVDLIWNVKDTIVCIVYWMLLACKAENKDKKT